MTIYSELLTIFTVQLFIIVDPLAGIPIFLSITPDKTKTERQILARRGCIVAFFVIVFFLVAGSRILSYLGITTSAVIICGGILLFVISLELLYGKASGTGTSSREEKLAEEKQDISVTPLAIPILSGPGAIATTLAFAGQTTSLPAYATLIVGTAIVFISAYAALHWAEELAIAIGTLGMKILTRIMGLLLAFIAVQYVINGIQMVLADSVLIQ